MAERKARKRVPGYKSENQKYKSLLVMHFPCTEYKKSGYHVIEIFIKMT